MSVMTRLKGVFSTGAPARQARAERTGRVGPASSMTEVKHAGLPDAPVPVDESPEPAALGRRGKQELIDELQKNYQEVLGLVRKVDQHLDAQQERGERLQSIAERVPPALDTLPAIQEQTARLSEAIDRLADTTARHAARSEASAQAQAQTLAHVKSVLEQSQAASKKLTASVEAFTESVQSVTTATEEVGRVIERVEQRGAAREKQLAELIQRGSKTMTYMTGFCGLAFTVTVIVLLVAMAS